MDDQLRELLTNSQKLQAQEGKQTTRGEIVHVGAFPLGHPETITERITCRIVLAPSGSAAPPGAFLTSPARRS